MAIQTMDDAQGKADKKVDRSFNKKKKFIPLIERPFNELHTLAEQFEWLHLKKKQKEKNQQ